MDKETLQKKIKSGDTVYVIQTKDGNYLNYQEDEVSLDKARVFNFVKTACFYCPKGCHVVECWLIPTGQILEVKEENL